MSPERRRALEILGALGLGAAASAVVGCTSTEPVARDTPDPLDRLSASGREPEVVRVGITPTSGKSTAALLDPLVEYLGTRHQLVAKVTTAPTYESLADSIRAGQIDAAFFSPLAYVTARASLPAVPVASGARAGSPTYLGYLIVSREDEIDSLLDLEGRSIGWVDRDSASGYLYARALLRSRGKDPDAFFGEQVFYGNHLAVISAVAAREVDVGATASAFVDSERSDASEAQARVKVVAKTSRIPVDCAVVHESLSRGLARRWRDALLALSHDRDAAERLSQAWGMSGFVSVDASHYDEIAAVLAAEQPS